MSLIHDALKKAQANAQIARQGTSPMTEGIMIEGDHKPKISRRTQILLVLLVGALLFFAYTKLRHGTLDTATSLPNTPQILLNEKNAEAKRLKGQAVEAFRTGDLDTAWANLTAAGTLDDKDPEVWNNLGLVSRKRGELEKAREAYQKALVLRPNYPECLNNLAVLELQSGDISAATTHLKNAIAENQAYPEALFHLALIAELEGNHTAAVDYYKQFLKVGGSLPSHLLEQVRSRVLALEP